MAVSFSPELLNRLYAPGIAEFTSCNAPDISATHPEAQHWLVNHFLNSMLRAEYRNKFRQYAINQIYRAQAAFADYHEARLLTAEFLDSGRPENPASRSYFRALSRWESCFLNLQIFIDVLNKMKKDFNDDPVFKEGDSSPAQRAYTIANMVKHWGTEIYAGRHDEGDSVPLWLTNHGLKTKKAEMTFSELAQTLSEVGTAANQLQDPKSYVQPE